MPRDKHGRLLGKDDAVLMPFLKAGQEYAVRMRVRALYRTGAGIDEAHLYDGEGHEFFVACAVLEKVAAPPATVD